MSNYGQVNGEQYDDYNCEECDDYYELEYYNLIQENDEYAEAVVRFRDGWFYNEEPRTIGDAVGRIY